MEKNPEFVVRIIGDLPFYLPVPDGTELSPAQIGVEPFLLFFKHISSPPPKGVSSAVGVEDGRGNLIFTRANVDFTGNQSVPEKPEDYLPKSIDLINRALIAVKLVSTNHCVRNISVFSHHVVQILRRHKNGKTELVSGEEGYSYGPHGLRAIGTINHEGMQRVWLHFQGLRPMQASWLLLIDSAYNLDFDDYPRSILDIATALEIHMPALIDEYLHLDSSLAGIDIERMGVYDHYDSLLNQITGHSLHDKPDLFVALEFIRQTRNSITHNWKPVFRITDRFKRGTKYISKHQPNDGKVINSKTEVNKMKMDASDIMAFASECFFNKYGESSL